MARVLGVVAAAVGLVIVFVASLVGGVFLHSGTAAAQRLVLGQVNAAIAGRFRGSIELTGLKHVGPTGVDGLDADVRDADGRTVATVRGVTVHVSLPALVWGALHPRRDLPVVLTRARVHRIDVTLIRGADGQPTLTHAFEPRHPSRPRPPGRGVRVDVPAAQVDEIAARGRLASFEALDARVDGLAASFVHDSAKTSVDVKRVAVRIGGVLPEPATAQITAHAILPVHGARDLGAAIDGRLGRVAFRAHGTMRGDAVDAVADVPDARPEAVRALVPGVAVSGPATLHARVHGTLPTLGAAVLVDAGDGRILLDGSAHLGSTKALDAVLHVEHVDPRRVVATAPDLRVDAQARVHARLEPGGVASAELTLHASEPGVPLDLHAVARRSQAGTVVDVHASSLVRDLALVPQLAAVPVAGGAQVAVAGRVDLDRRTVDADLEGQLAEAHLPSASLRAAVVRASAKGPLRSPQTRATVSAEGIRLAGRTIDFATMDLSGSARDATVRASVRGPMIPTVRLRATLALEHGFGARDVRVEASRGGTDAVARIAELRAAGRDIDVRGIDVVGLGAPVTGNMRVARGAIAARLLAPGVDLRRVARLLGEAGPRGRLAVDADVHVDAAGAAGHVDGRLDAQDLLGFHSSRAVLGLRLLGRSVDGTALLEEASGPVAWMTLEAAPPIERLLHANGDALAMLERMPVRLHAEVPEHELSALPAGIRPAAVKGSVGATLDFDGSVLDPRVDLRARAQGIRSAQSQSALPFDGTVDATYDGRAAIVRAVVLRPRGVVLDARADVDAPLAPALTSADHTMAWDAGATVALHDFPLAGIPQIATRGMGGLANGVVEVRGLHRDASADADVRIAQPHLGAACFQGGRVQLQVDRGHLAAQTVLARPGSYAAVRVDATTRWGASMAPSLNTSEPIDATLEAHDFRAGALMPFLQGPVNELDGLINARVRVHANPAFKTGSFDGDVRFSQGTVEIPALGEPLHGVTARVSIRPWGTLRIDDVHASGPTGRLTASARATFAGMKLETATADLDIPRNERLPLAVEGVPLGEASGHVHADATMSPDQKQLAVKVDVPNLQVSLPETSGRSLQSLEPAPNVAVGVVEPDGRFVPLPQHAPEKPRSPGALRIHAVFDLGREVRIARDANLDVMLTGSPAVDVNQKSRVTGAIHLVRGMVYVYGHKFTIQPASTVSFTGDASNPQLVVTALYEAPDGTKIYADVVGTPKKMKVRMRSEPVLSQDQILGLLLFGSEEGLAGTPPPNQQADVTQSAVGLASGVMTQGINKALSGVTTLEIATRVNTSEAANPRPEVEVRVSNDVLTRLTVQTGMPAPGEPRDTTLVTIDWRFEPRWSLQTTVGDAGSTFVDLLWNHRY